MDSITEISTLTAKGQASIPALVRKHLGLNPGDKVIWREQEDGSFTIQKATAEDIRWSRFVFDNLQDWNDPGDEIYNEL